MILKYVKLFFGSFSGLLLLTHCSNNRLHTGDLDGHYKSGSVNNIITDLKKISYASGNELVLKKDSTYIYITCGNYIEGHWTVKNDSLLMFCKSNKFMIDSLNITGLNEKLASCGTGADIFIIYKNRLEQSWVRNNITYINRLNKMIDSSAN